MCRLAGRRLESRGGLDNFFPPPCHPDIAEDRRRLDNFKRTREAIPLRDVKAWVEGRGTDKELPRPKPQRLG